MLACLHVTSLVSTCGLLQGTMHIDVLQSYSLCSNTPSRIHQLLAVNAEMITFVKVIVVNVISCCSVS